MEHFKSQRKAWTIGDYRVFGDILPFIGFETVEADAKEICEHYNVEVPLGIEFLYGNFFTLEWFGKGVSFGGFDVPTED